MWDSLLKPIGDGNWTDGGVEMIHKVHRLLDEMEEVGMFPPQYRKVISAKEDEHPRAKEIYDINEWEPEDED